MLKNLRVLYLYAGPRRAFYQKFKKGLTPDTQLLGLNHMEEFGINAEFLEYPLAEFLRKVNFNLVHLPYLFSLLRYNVVFICAGLPLVFLARYLLGRHRPFFVIYNTYLNNTLKLNAKGIKGFIVRRAIETIDVIICTAQSQQQSLIDSGFDPKKVIYQPIGIDNKKFSEAGVLYSPDPSDQYIASAGRDLGRDYKTLFMAVEDLPIKIKVATKKETIQGLKIPDNVKVYLDIPYEKMPEFYAKASFVITPLSSPKQVRGSDTSGQYGYLEPMATGKAVIVSDRGTVRDYITHNQDGWIIPPEDPEALRKAIELFRQNPQKVEMMGKRAQEKVCQNFSSHQFAKFLAKIFYQLSTSRI